MMNSIWLSRRLMLAGAAATAGAATIGAAHAQGRKNILAELRFFVVFGQSMNQTQTCRDALRHG